MDLQQLLNDIKAQIAFSKMIPSCSVQTIDGILTRIQLFELERALDLSSESLPLEV
jgi:hypothetical protein